MPKPTKGPRIGGSPTHQRIIMRNLATQLFEHGRITTTETKARRLQPLAEKLLTKAKRGDLHSRRLVLQSVTSQEVVHKLFAEIAPGLEGREGGYTRITKIGPRKGDNAPMAIIEIVTESVDESRSRRPKKAAAKAEPTSTQAEETPAEEQADTEEAEVATESEAVETDAAPEAAAADEIAAEEAPEAAEADADAEKA